MWLYSIRKRIPLTVAKFSYHVGKLLSTEGDLDMFCHLPISLLSIYPREMCTHLYQETCTCRFITLVVIAKKWRPFKCLTIEQWIKCYTTPTTIKMDKLQLHTNTDLTSILWREGTQTQHNAYCIMA